MPIQTQALSSLCAVLALTLAACGSSDDSPTRGAVLTVVTDTIGDTIVVRTDGDIPVSEELQLVERWRVGDPDGDETTSFGRVSSATLGANDELFVFESTVPQLRRYAGDGSLVNVISRKGSGPGEYTRSNGMTVITDGRLVLWDAENSRLNVYASDGTPLTSWMPPVQSFFTGGNSVSPLADGGFVMRAFVRDTTLTREAIGRGAWFRFDSSGTLRDTVLAPFYGDPPENLIATRAGSRSSQSVPFAATPQTAMGLAGQAIGSPGAPYEVYTFADGRPLRIERAISPVPVDDAERAQRREQLTWSMRRTQPDWSWNGPDIPTEKPPVIGVLPAGDGQLLVSIATPSEPFDPEPPREVEGEVPRPIVAFRSPVVYELFRADGTLRGRLRLPFGAQLFVLRGSDAWGTVVDSLDVPSLVRWRIEESSN